MGAINITTMSYFVHFTQQICLCPIKKKQVISPRHLCVLVLCDYPRAAVMNYHKLGGLKQQKFICLQFWRPKAKTGGEEAAASSSF